MESKIKDKEKYYLLFDEIQNVQDFERVINSFSATMNVSIFITGSNSKLFSKDDAIYIFIIFRIKKSRNEEITEKTFDEFIEWEVCN